MSSPGSGDPNQYANISGTSFVASFGSGLASFGALLALFYILKIYFPRIYRPRTYLVPEKERIPPPPDGLFAWIKPVFLTPNSEFIRKCGLDAYFFLRYLRMLLKIFIPMACVILPILLPLNATGGVSEGPSSNVTALNALAWSNVSQRNANRYWAHLVLAVATVLYICYIVFGELKGYIKLRQAYLTSPQHRLRASATTVLVTSIPPKWLTREALDGLYDVFPGGIRNIWINRNLQELSDKVDRRNTLANKLESAETNLIRNAKQKQMEDAAKQAKKDGLKKTKQQKINDKLAVDDAAERTAARKGKSSGNPHQVQTLRQFFHRGPVDHDSQPSSKESSPDRKGRMAKLGLDKVGDGLGKTVGQGLSAVTGGVGKLSHLIPGSHDSPKSNGQGDHEHHASDHADQEDPFRGSGEARQEESQAPEDHATSPKTSMRSAHQFGHKRTSTEKTGSDQHFASDGVHDQDQPTARRDSPRMSLDPLDLVTQSHWKFWQKNQPEPSPIPHMKDQDEFPLAAKSQAAPDIEHRAMINGTVDGATASAPHDTSSPVGTTDVASSSSSQHKDADHRVEKVMYPAAYDADVAEDSEEDAVWRKYLKPGDRSTMRLPLFNLNWMPFMPSWTFIGKKVDTIYYCRKELARLNLEIETDQKEPEKFPLMNSAFIQFNHQVAAHMACQSVSHHLPQQMAPRLIEIAPDDVLWDNMSIKWWEIYVRTGVVIVVVAGMIIFWAIPIAFSGFVSQFSTLATLEGFHWVSRIPKSAASVLQGILPPAIISILFVLVPIILRLLHNLQGVHTGNAVEITLQKSYFAFLFVQLFLVGTISSSALAIVQTLKEISGNITSVPSILAQNIPKAANYFFNYMILQALSTSAGALAQIGVLIMWFVLRPIVDSTARQKWSRQLKLPEIKWGQFFPIYTNFACIGMIYSIIAPLVLVFNIITFSLFWVAYRYNILYVNKFRFDTGGLLFPNAVNQLFTGVYVMELALIGLFFLVRNEQNQTAAKAQGIIMIVVLVFTILFQYLLNDAFSPLFRYLPITLEDEAVIRDEEFARAQEEHFRLIASASEDGREADRKSTAESHELRQFESSGTPRSPGSAGLLSPWSWAERSRTKSRERRSLQMGRSQSNEDSGDHTTSRSRWDREARKQKIQDVLHPKDAALRKQGVDVEAQKSDYDYLFGGRSDEIEDLTPDERDALVERAFRHRALRARRPVIWVPRDDLGVSDDEIKRTGRLTDYVWISNDGTGLDSNGKVLFRKPPPDFSDLDLIDP